MTKNNRLKFDVWGLITLFFVLCYVAFLLIPLGMVLYQALINKTNNSFTLEYFSKFFGKSYYFSTLINSFKVSICATFLSILIGTPLAYFFTMFRLKGKKILQTLIIIASMSAPFIGAYSWILLLGRSGIITGFLKSFGIGDINIYGFSGILLVFTCQLYPLIFLYVQGALKNVDHSLIEASKNLGCSNFKIFYKIVLPLIMPTILAGGLLVFVRAMSDFGTPMLIGEGYRTFPVLIFNEFMSEVSGDDGFASAIAIMAVLITAVIFLLMRYISKRFSFSMSALHPIEAKKVSGLKSFFVHLYCYGVVMLSILPQAFVIYTSFKNTKGLIFVDGYSLMSYQQAFQRLGNSIINTVMIPGTALLLIVVVAVLISYLAVRRRKFLTGFLDTISMIPYVIPGSVLGIAFGITFKNKWITLSSFMLLVIAMVMRRLPYTIRSSAAILHQIPMSIEEAAISLGASKLKTFLKVTMPMMASGIIAGAILSWVTLISELSTSIILYTTKTKTLTISIYTEVLRGNYGIGAALSTILTVMTIVSLFIFYKLSKGKDISI